MNESTGGAGGLLSGRVAMITGASSGIGAAAARLFAAEGAAVVLMARREEELGRIVEGIAAEGGRALAAPGDVTRSEDVRRVVTAAVDTFGQLDVAFNNAGWGTAGTDLHETEDAVFDQVMDVNVRGLWNCLRHQLPAMLVHGSGSVVNTASTAGVVATGAGAPYVAAKHAVIGMTKAAAAEYGGRGIRVNSLVVGTTRTELIEGAIAAHPHLEEFFVARQIQKRMADPDEVAQAALWLAGPRSSFVTGAALAVDGGLTAV
ncbi:SDR family NAD(P)-dependent oxidoreductase [Streptomyces sp. Wb2n-11]|uniref:SDR family NAD(P)-dependent oxidoreductase n=1 Tax=Streptomyces sp. Wb2n-11 TaxID=1030533 RepID=UPI000A492B20|nr:glucose 1-dehydrogenase [Streptomyces sp. Wb2n-11]